MNTADYSRRLACRVEDVLEKIKYNSLTDDGIELRVGLARAFIYADAIKELADSVMCITTGTDKVMGIAESLHLIEEKIGDLSCGRELMEIAESLKDLRT